MADTTQLSSKQLFEAMESAWKADEPDEVIKYATALSEQARPDELQYRMEASIALGNFTPWPQNYRHAQEAVRLVDVDMRARAQDFPSLVFEENLVFARFFLKSVREHHRALVQEIVARARKEREEADKQEEREKADEKKEEEQSVTGNEDSEE